MSHSITLPARKNGRRLARDAAPGNGDFDIHSLAAWAQGNLTRPEIERVIAMLQGHLAKAEDDEPADLDARERATGGLDSALRSPTAAKGFASRYPNVPKRII